MSTSPNPGVKAPKTKARPSYGARQLSGLKGNITKAINASTDGAYIELDIKMGYNLIEVIDQLQKYLERDL